MALGVTLQITTGCEGRLSILHPAGPAAQTIADIWWIMLGSGAAIFAVVMVVLMLALRRAGDQPAGDPPEGEQRSTRVWMWGFGLAFPMITRAALTGYGLIMGDRLLARAAPDLVTVAAEARQWAWTFRYDDVPNFATEGVLHIPAGQPVDVEITSIDVIHSFWVPRLAGKLDAIPGHVNVLRIEAAAPGTYAGQSAEFSGAGYREHVFTVQAHDAASWETFLREGTP